MDLKWIYTFLSAAENENFRKTSEELFISQPSVSVHIKLLEEYLGTVLFQRNGRRVMLTEEGRRFFPHAKDLIDAHEKGVQELNRFKQGFSKKLTLAISPIIAASIMPVILKRYMTKNPDVEIEVRVLDSKEIAVAVLSGSVDLGLSRLSFQHPEITCKPLYEDKVILVSPHDGGDMETSPPLDAEELLNNQIVITHNHPEYWDSLFRELNTRFKNLRTMVVSEVHVTKRFIEEGLGVSFLPYSTVRRELMEGRLLDVNVNFMELPIAHTYALLKYEHSQERHFLQFLLQFRLP